MEIFLIWLVVGIALDAFAMVVLSFHYDWPLLTQIKETPWWAHVLMVLIPPSALLAIDTHMGGGK